MTAPRIGRVGVVLAALLLAAGPAAAEEERDYRPDPPRDEFGLLPDQPVDEDLALPDDHLDRTWPGPEPGQDPNRPDYYLERDEEDSDPFEADAPRRPGRPGVPGADAGDPYAEEEGGDEEDADDAEDPDGEARPVPPPRPLIAPDGRIDPGSPYPEADPRYTDPLDGGAGDSAGLQPMDDLPSPLDQDDYEFDEEMSDPGEW